MFRNILFHHHHPKSEAAIPSQVFFNEVFQRHPIASLGGIQYRSGSRQKQLSLGPS